MTTVLIAGCGYLGTTLGLLLDRLGHEVWGLRRDPRGLPAPLTPVAGDLTDPASLRLPEVAWLVYAAAPGERTDAGYAAIYPRGLAHVLVALGRGPLERAVFVSSTAVYGDAGGDWVDEATTPVPDGFNGERLLEAEAVLAAADVEGIAVRLGGIYGPGRTRLIESVLNGESDLPGGPRRYTNRIHRDDAALALAHLLELEQPDPVYNGVDRDPASQEEVLTWLADRLDAPRPRTGGADAGSPRGNKRVSSERLVASGFEFRYPSFREGYEALIQDLGESTWSPAERAR